MVPANPRPRKPLEDGPDLSAFDADIIAFYRYWGSKRRGRWMPARADIDPVEIVPLCWGSR